MSACSEEFGCFVVVFGGLISSIHIITMGGWRPWVCVPLIVLGVIVAVWLVLSEEESK